MKHDRLKPIIQAVCYACDYGDNTNIKADELWERLFPLNQTMNNKHSIDAMYAIIHTTLEILKELECISVTDVEENLKANQDSVDIHNLVNNKKK